MSKKIISILLAVMLTVSMFAVAAVSVSAKETVGPYEPESDVETYRYYFYMPSDWNNGYGDHAGIYWWEGTGHVQEFWPGYDAFATDAEGVYYCDVPTDVTTIIWNNAFDGGEDQTAPEYSKAIQTINIGSEYYDAGESDNYPEGTENFNEMIFVVNPDAISINDFNGKQVCGGEWYYYYGNGEYGFAPTKDEASEVFNTDYQPPLADQPSSDEPSSDEPSSDEPSSDEPSSDEPSSDEPSSEEASSDAPAGNAPYLTVNATSNIAPTTVAEYDEGIDKVTVTYNFASNKNIQSTQWVIKYDPAVLTLSSSVNKRTICPTIKDAVVNFDIPGEIYFNVSNLNLYDFSSEDADKIFATVAFDVNDISAVAPVETTVDLDVEVLQLSLLDENFEVIPEEEVTLVSDHVFDADAATAVNASTSTEFAPTDFDHVDQPSIDEPSSDEPSSDEPSSDEPSSDEPSSDEPSSDEPSSDEPSSEEPSSDEPSSEEPSTDAPSSDDSSIPAPSTDDADSSVDDSTLAPSTSDSVEGDNGTVQTGQVAFALIILSILVAATGVMFALRKREMY